MITSRPSASACLHHVVDKRIEILGFEQSSKIQYVTEALQDSPSKLEKLQRHFQQYPNIDAICYIPLMMSIIIFLCMCQPDELPPTATELYASFILHTVCHYLKRAGKIPENTIIHKLEQLPPVLRIALQDLEKIAFYGLVKDKIVFTVEDLPVLCWHDPTCYGLLQSTECYSAEEIGTPTQSFNFLYLGIQEYFAAKYVITLPEDEVYTLLKESFVTESRFNPNFDNKDVRLSNMWILYCGITSGRCKSLRYYLTTYGKPDSPFKGPLLNHSQATSMTSQEFDFCQQSTINLSYHPLAEPVHTIYPLTPSSSQHITSYTEPHQLPTMNHPHYHQHQQLAQQQHEQQEQQSVQYPYFQPSMTNPCCIRSQDPMLYLNTLTMCSPHVLSSVCKTDDWSISSTDPHKAISQDILIDPVKVIYLFQCFQEAQDSVLCEFFSKSFDSDVIHISRRLLPHRVVSLGFFLSRSHRKWRELNLFGCHIGDHGMSILYQFGFGDKTIKQGIAEIILGGNELTGASSHVVSDIISHLQPHTLQLDNNNITNLTNISTTIISDSTVRILGMRANNITAQEAIATSDMMICLEELCISDNKLGDRGAELISEGIANTKTLRVLEINGNNIGSLGSTVIGKALSTNVSLEELYMGDNTIGHDGAKALSKAIINHQKLKNCHYVVKMI